MIFVLNGVSKGEKKGEHKHINRQSIVDLCAKPGKWMTRNISRLLKKVGFCEEVDPDNSNATQKLRWIESKTERYKTFLPLQIETSIKEIEGNITRAVCTAKSYPRNPASYNFKSDWLDKDCMKLRNNFKVFKTLYLRINREYK